MVCIIKKDGTKEEFNVQKIVRAVNKSAGRILYQFTEEEIDFICRYATEKVEGMGKPEISIQDMHNVVEGALEKVNPAVAKSYRDYRNYKHDFIHMMDEVYTKSQSIRYIGDKSNANTDSALVATKRSLIFNELNKELYRKFFMNRNELQACKDGYIYIHDQSARLDTMNCCLFDVANVLRGGFEMGNVWYNEPKTLDTAFDVMGDIILSTAAQQYGGFTVPEVDRILAPYAEKSYHKYKEEFLKYVDPDWELTNPAAATMQVMGVYEEALVRPMAEVLFNLGVKRGMVVYGQDCLDEISLSAPTSVCEIKDGTFEEYVITPEEFGMTRCTKEELVGGTPQENAEITKEILAGKKGPARDAVVLNAAAALHAAKEIPMQDAVKLAEELIDSGKAQKKLEEFVSLTNKLAEEE